MNPFSFLAHWVSAAPNVVSANHADPGVFPGGLSISFWTFLLTGQCESVSRTGVQCHLWTTALQMDQSGFWLFSRGCCCCSVAQLHPTVYKPPGLQHSRLPCLSLSSRVCSDSCSLSRWGQPTISSSVIPLLLPSVFPSIRVSVLKLRNR